MKLIYFYCSTKKIGMKDLLSYVLLFILLLNFPSYKVLASEKESKLDKSQLIIINKYAERFCSAKNNNFFEGLDNERTLKYSYFKYIGFQDEEIYSKVMYKALINRIKEKCLINKEEETELNEFLSEK